ncbi:DNA gyrase inhibitor YacG [Dechloromonas sp. ARDL1]|uniref:DNA gyrase inhibitor YacG n=1 Tax=Dechloromonas sp. ARDL1 TaxID=3322121 RepID=UPI003DA72C12
MAARKVRCPQCGEDALWAPENPWRPFCSERCKQIDLGCWASDSYRIESKAGDDGLPDLDLPDTPLR